MYYFADDSPWFGVRFSRVSMLVFRMDTTGLFRYGQRHELRILFPRESKNRYPGAAGGGGSGANAGSVAGGGGDGGSKVSNGLARHLLGRSNSHYVRANAGHSSSGFLSKNHNRNKNNKETK